MATVKATFSTGATASGNGDVQLVTWLLTATDDGSPLGIEWANWADRSVQVGITGDNFNAGTVVIEGSNDGTTWTTLFAAAPLAALSFTAAGLKEIVEMTAYIRPRASVSVTSVNVVMAIRRAQPLRT